MNKAEELRMLRGLQADNTRWLSQEEFDRIQELIKKPLKKNYYERPIFME